jgi:hypothetical protein
MDYINRDKSAYKEIMQNWLRDNIDDIIERVWEIEDISYLTETGDFIKLLREAESLYELGFYTSCIALIGISAEDFTKYLAIKLEAIKLESISQYCRIKKLREQNIINDEIYNSLDNIRMIRNGCLHFDDNFKRKKEDELRKDALTALNSLKIVLKEIFGAPLSDFDSFLEILKNIADPADGEIKENFDIMSYKVRNAVSQLFNFDIVFNPEKKDISTDSIYEILEIDLDYRPFGEITLIDLMMQVPVVVDLKKENKEYIKSLNLSVGDKVRARILSTINQLGLSATWEIKEIIKLIQER